ncbi:hypothetical protein PRZ48_005500 [Zasmidium cellare]|uniref:Amino acid permease/ SLC12A domain-containing protein n=1 Tax=Zasmidium cellare TaxID=395010 RepID=A0ABR0ET69_ZASCE|nr:hypothetical protein PRZ48_005500 [Zasmidium cellare]
MAASTDVFVDKTASTSHDDSKKFPRKVSSRTLDDVEIDIDHGSFVSHSNSARQDLQRGLGARQITMIAIGGALGTGLLIGTGQALAIGGPASVLISYTIVGAIVFTVMMALG